MTLLHHVAWHPTIPPMAVVLHCPWSEKCLLQLKLRPKQLLQRRCIETHLASETSVVSGLFLGS